MNSLRRMIWASGLSIVCLFSTGCGDSAGSAPKWPDPVQVNGKVVLKGKPLANAQVIFVPSETTVGQGGSGQTNEAGEFSIQTRWSNQKLRDGLIAGRYKVALSRYIKPDGSVWIPDPEATEGPASSGAREELPPNLSNPAESTITVEVAAGKTTYDLDVP